MRKFRLAGDCKHYILKLLQSTQEMTGNEVKQSLEMYALELETVSSSIIENNVIFKGLYTFSRNCYYRLIVTR